MTLIECNFNLVIYNRFCLMQGFMFNNIVNKMIKYVYIYYKL